MRATIHIPVNKLLAAHIDYFLILQNEKGSGHYKTFPNVNLCLALYKENGVIWDRSANQCTIRPSAVITNKLFGFHKKPFTVAYSGKVDQICILFKPGGISFFSKIPTSEIELAESPWTQLFGSRSNEFIEVLFSLESKEEKLQQLELFLLKRLTYPGKKVDTVMQSIRMMRCAGLDENGIIQNLARRLAINSSTLYRHFLAVAGQSPVELYQTIRFRSTLDDLMRNKQSFTKTAYDNNFFDQSHLIKSIRKYSGETPSGLIKNISEVQHILYWVKNDC